MFWNIENIKTIKLKFFNENIDILYFVPPLFKISLIECWNIILKFDLKKDLSAIYHGKKETKQIQNNNIQEKKLNEKYMKNRSSLTCILKTLTEGNFDY